MEIRPLGDSVRALCKVQLGHSLGCHCLPHAVLLLPVFSVSAHSPLIPGGHPPASAASPQSSVRCPFHSACSELCCWMASKTHMLLSAKTAPAQFDLVNTNYRRSPTRWPLEVPFKAEEDIPSIPFRSCDSRSTRDLSSQLITSTPSLHTLPSHQTLPCFQAFPSARAFPRTYNIFPG